MSNGKPIFAKIKLRFLIYMTIIGLGLFFIVSISFFSGNTLKNNSQMITVLAKQRMLTQAFSKNASRIHLLNDALLSQESIQSNEILESKLRVTIEQLITDASTYQSVYTDLSNGFVVTPADETIRVSKNALSQIEQEINFLNKQWMPFSDAINVIVSEDENSIAFKEALIYINENNLSLLDASEAILSSFETNMQKQYEVYQFIILMLIFLIVSVAALLMYQMYDDMFKALNIFYAGFEKLGLSRNYKNNSDNINVSFSDEVKLMINGFTDTLELTEKINASQSFIETLNYIFKSFKSILPYTYIGIALLTDQNPQTVIATYGITEDQHKGLAESLVGYEVNVSDTSLGQIMHLKEPRIINDMNAYFVHRPINPYSQMVMDYGIKSSVTLPLEANGVPLGFIFFSSDQPNVYEHQHIEYLKILSTSIALSFQKNIFMDELVYSSVLALAKLSEARDEDTGDHLVRMSHYVELIANELKKEPQYKDIITREYVESLVKFSPMHDIGKVGIPDGILLKPGKLTAAEFEIMKTHTIYGANVLVEAEKNINKKGRSLFATGIEIALNHHEKFDGSGYPNGIKGEEIPLSARIVAVADVFDALLSKRPYKEPFTMAETLKIIKEGRGKHFDPVIVDAFLALYDL
ncbi:HD domain-containing protein [Fusibacter bizertensis]|uniref:HD domain-containing protein n=1 Tax=Fusibacter bizertensis TaxID=1488331 RepID=A0ABT6NAF0_9FIRM|nr:HD domain-containing phosphohydrolase [Fusibacter bizertensis]MDH8677379.1 HD domain-containing protein [Fusibacter bizertensis]